MPCRASRRPGSVCARRCATDFEWVTPDGCPAHLPLRRLARTDSRGIARTLSCHQAIAGDSCFALGLLATFEAALAEGAWRYRQLFWEAGLIGQALYLEAEAAGLRGTRPSAAISTMTFIACSVWMAGTSSPCIISPWGAR